jgi:hypothetical protein
MGKSEGDGLTQMDPVGPSTHNAGPVVRNYALGRCVCIASLN